MGAAGLLLAAAARASRSAWTSRSHSMWRSTILTSLSAVSELTNAASTWGMTLSLPLMCLE